MTKTEVVVDRIAENAWGKFVSRIAIIFASVVGMPLCLFFLSSTLARIDQMAEDRQEDVVTITRLQGVIASLQGTIVELGIDRYRGADAGRDFRLRDQKDAEQDRRLDGHDNRFGELYRRISPPR